MESNGAQNRNQDPSLTVETANVRLNHLTYDAREVVERSRRQDDLKLYMQVMLIQGCYNYGVNKMVKALGPQKSGFTNDEPLSAMMEGGLRPWVMKNPIRQVEFSKKAIWNLYRIDSLVLVSDFGVRLERLVELLGRLSNESLEEIAWDTGLTTMPIFMSEMEQFFAMVEQSVRELNSSHTVVIDSVKPVDPTLMKVAEAGLADLRMIGDMEKKNRT